MKRLIIVTLLLFAATVLVTLVYFSHLNRSGQSADPALRRIPNNASIIFEFSNDKDFYDIFAGNKLFSALIGQDKQDELFALRKLLLQNPQLGKYFSNEDIYISLLPQKGNTIDFLFTASVSKEFQDEFLEQFAKKNPKGMLITPTSFSGKPGYQIYLSDLKRRFYLINKDDLSLSGSFSKDVIESYAKYDYRKEKDSLVLLPEQQRINSLANVYVNYRALNVLAEQLFSGKNPEFFKTFREMPAAAALSIDYKSDALLFNGTSQVQTNQPNSYLNVLDDQQPIINSLKEIFPSTTAYFTNIALSNPAKFENRLSAALQLSGFAAESSSILKKIKMQTGLRLQKEFAPLLGNEFAVVTTQYREKFGIIQITDGVKLLALLTNISKMNSDNSGQFNFEKIPQILFGDAFALFKRPYFRVIDNYLIITNSESELASYYDIYFNRKFLPKTEGYNNFNNLLAQRSNLSFFVRIKNTIQLFKQDMRPSFFNDFSNSDPGWKNFYGASWQMSVSEKTYYTNFCLGLPRDTTTEKAVF